MSTHVFTVSGRLEMLTAEAVQDGDYLSSLVGMPDLHMNRLLEDLAGW